MAIGGRGRIEIQRTEGGNPQGSYVTQDEVLFPEEANCLVDRLIRRSGGEATMRPDLTLVGAYRAEELRPAGFHAGKQLRHG